MSRFTLPAAIAIVAIAAGITLAAQAADLRIVVVRGEDAVNILQQKTAVAPVVEVRDRNNLPVPGATVTFSIGGQGASFGGGVQTLTVTTNAAGQATAAGLTPTASGAIQVNATAAIQGQSATTVITQTNFATVQAAQAAGASVAGGGGLSTGAVAGIVGGVGAVAGGAVVLTQAGGDDTTAGQQGGTSTQTPPACLPRQPTQGSGSAPFEGSFEMGRTSGTFDFRYDSGNFEDHFIVIYEGRALFDTGCVATEPGVGRVQTIAYAGSSTTITVRVNANCTGRPDNPFWNFTVGCPR
jgi:hypothetical protein